MLTPKVAGTRVVGCAKSGWTPTGGCPAGRVSKMATGRAATSFGSVVLVDMIMTIRLSCRE